jgi:hypothetical protein
MNGCIDLSQVNSIGYGVLDTLWKEVCLEFPGSWGNDAAGV